MGQLEAQHFEAVSFSFNLTYIKKVIFPFFWCVADGKPKVALSCVLTFPKSRRLPFRYTGGLKLRT